MTDDKIIFTVEGDTPEGRRLAMSCAAAASALGTAASDYVAYVKRCAVTGSVPVPRASLERAGKIMSVLTMLMATGGSITAVSPPGADERALQALAEAIPRPEQDKDPGPGRI